MDFDDIKAYWDRRAADNVEGAKATTDDVYMKEIEYQRLREVLLTYRSAVADVADIGCGDGVTTLKLCRAFPEIRFTGYDYSANMIRNAKINHTNSGVTNARFVDFDIVNNQVGDKYDLIYTTRCLINLPSEEMQFAALEKISGMLRNGGIYVMIENFIDGQEEFNSLRSLFGLPEIPVRDHNLYFRQENLMSFAKNIFEVASISNISSLYYVVSRIIYSKICQANGEQPDYHDIHHRLASLLPICGNYGPIKMIVLKTI